ncbi:hypothetical protein AAA627_39630, partial [Pseudomonas aeruginosa]
ALRDSQALAALGDAWATHQGQLAAFVQRRQRALESQAQLPELEKSLAQAGEPLERLQAQWTALHGSEPDDLAARLDELRRQTDSLERQQALHKEWQQALDQRTGLARRLG